MAKGIGAAGETVATIAHLVKPDGNEAQIPVFACDWCNATGLQRSHRELPGEAEPCEHCVNGLTIQPHYSHKRLPFTGTVKAEGIRWVKVSGPGKIVPDSIPYEEYFKTHRF